ncbi:MAG: PQQ-binding-like beta-propeller repeat protein [Massilia sp.]
MQVMFRYFGPLVLGLVLAGCGGGGGGGDSGGGSGGTGGAANPDGAWLTFTPNPVAVTVAEGDSTTFQITATSSRTFSKPFNVAVIDGTGVITTSVQVSALSQLQYQATLQTSSALRAGEHPTTLEVRLCEDDPLVCHTPLPGSPWRVPLNVTVKPSADAGKRVTVSVAPSTLSLVAYPGEVATVELRGQIGGDTLTKSFQVGVIDPSAVIAGAVTSSDAHGFSATLTTVANLAQGDYKGNVEVRLCYDDPRVCGAPVPGSPWLVPLNLAVKSSRDADKHVTVSVTPSALALVTYPGEVATVDVRGQIGGDMLSRSFQVGVIDPSAGVTGVTTFADAHGFGATLTTSTGLVLGDYNSNVEVRLCFDDPRVCSLPVPGSPWLVPLKVAVKSPVNLTKLVPVSGIGAWSTYQGNAAHTGFVAASFDVAKFSRRWNIPAISGSMQPLNGAASDNGMVFVTRTDASGRAEVVAISEASGAEAWRTSLGAMHHVNPPAAGNRQVYVTTTGHEDSFLWVFDQRTGALQSKASLSSQWENYMAPTVVGTDVYTEDGYYGGLSKFSSVNGSRTWSAGMPQYDSWTPAVDVSNAYAYMSGQLIAVDVATGKDRWAVTDPENVWMGYMGAPVVLSGTQAFVANGGRVMAFDLARHTRAWSVSGTVTSQPAFGNGTVYVLNANGTVLEARSPADGRLQWTSESLGGGSFTRVIVTRNLAFVSSDNRTVAIDLATHKAVWSYPRGGDMSVSSNGVLYILGSDAALAAVNLQ